MGAVLERRAFVQRLPHWDHEHCSFCWEKFMPEGTSEEISHITEGYVTGDDNWVCPRCFADFRDEFGWTVVGDDPRK